MGILSRVKDGSSSGGTLRLAVGFGYNDSGTGFGPVCCTEELPAGGVSQRPEAFSA